MSNLLEQAISADEGDRAAGMIRRSSRAGISVSTVKDAACSRSPILCTENFISID
jgi:hypothetical protein